MFNGSFVALVTPMRADGSVELLSRPPDLLVGLLGPDRSDHEVTLEPGDQLLLYTDGLVETRDGDIDTDLDHLRQHVLRHRTDDPESLLDLLLALRPDPYDDIALLAVRVQES